MSDPRILNCEEALRLLAEHLDGELDAGVHGDVERHLESCRSCWSRAEFERQLKSRVGALSEQPVPSAFEARIRSLMDRFDDTNPLSPRTK